MCGVAASGKEETDQRRDWTACTGPSSDTKQSDRIGRWPEITQNNPGLYLFSRLFME